MRILSNILVVLLNNHLQSITIIDMILGIQGRCLLIIKVTNLTKVRNSFDCRKEVRSQEVAKCKKTRNSIIACNMVKLTQTYSQILAKVTNRSDINLNTQANSNNTVSNYHQVTHPSNPHPSIHSNHPRTQQQVVALMYHHSHYNTNHNYNHKYNYINNR